jgi:hypothetical protein
MRRALASLLLATISFPLIAATLLVDSEPKVPACCRRNGAHHCSMPVQTAEQSGDSTGPQITSVARCAAWPKAETPFTNFESAAPGAGYSAQAPVANWTANRSIQFNPTCRRFDSVRKRGPPSWLD